MKFIDVIKDMHEEDVQHGTRLVGFGPHLISADLDTQGSRICMAADSQAMEDIVSGKVFPLLLLIDKAEYAKRILTILLLLFTSFAATAQYGLEKLPEYTASNGVTYKPGDTIQLNLGSNPNGLFVYVTLFSRRPIGPMMANSYMVIKDIRKHDSKRFKRVNFILRGGIFKYVADIESAIAAGEIKQNDLN